METANGAEKLISSILEEARENASAIEWRSTEAIAAIKQKFERDCELVRNEFTKKANDARELTLKTARTNAELQGRKELLGLKRGVIDEAYASAYKKLCGLSGEKREALIKKLIARECEGSEVVCPSAKDRGIVEKLLPACGISGLTLGETDGTISDGFTLKGNNYYKNCSFEALLAEVRTVTEAEVTKKLFK